jgi:hypothetical protein
VSFEPTDLVCYRTLQGHTGKDRTHCPFSGKDRTHCSGRVIQAKIEPYRQTRLQGRTAVYDPAIEHCRVIQALLCSLFWLLGDIEEKIEPIAPSRLPKALFKVFSFLFFFLFFRICLVGGKMRKGTESETKLLSFWLGFLK